MIVCSCRAVTDQALLAVLAAGASADEAMALTGAGSDCGCCRSHVEAVIAEAPEEGCCGGPCESCPRRGKA